MKNFIAFILGLAFSILGLGGFFYFYVLNSTVDTESLNNKQIISSAPIEGNYSPEISNPKERIRIHGTFSILFPLEKLKIENSRLIINAKLETPDIENASPTSIDLKALQLAVISASIPKNGQGEFTIDFPKIPADALFKKLPDLGKSDSVEVKLQFRLCEKDQINCNEKGFMGKNLAATTEYISGAVAIRKIPISHFTDQNPHEHNWGRTMIANYFTRNAPSLPDCLKKSNSITGTIIGYNGFFEKIPKGKKAYVMSKPVEFQDYVNEMGELGKRKLDGYSEELSFSQNTAKFSVPLGTAARSRLYNLIVFFCSPAEDFYACAFQASIGRKFWSYVPQTYAMLYPKNLEVASCGASDLTLYAYGNAGDLGRKSHIRANEVEKGIPDEIYIADPKSL